MSGCELHEVNISALLDGELEPQALLPLLDHLGSCPRCRAFYEDARELGRLAAALPVSETAPAPHAPAAAAPPPARERAGTVAPAARGAWRRLFQPPVWAWGAAALLLLAIGFAGGHLAHGLPELSAPPSDAPVEITLGEDRGVMDQERFVALTIELLRADPRYHREMLQVLQQVQPTEQNEELVPLFAASISPDDHVRSTSAEGEGDIPEASRRTRRGLE
jgi:hypothetical protein